MSYLALARKWRPKKFTELVGQEHVLRALVNALESGRVHHAFLFTGTRGVGKTTIARILAKCLNCEKGISSSPCGECSACVDIDAGRFFDLIEVDAASRTKVDDTRDLLDNVQYAPARGRYKVYLIDEVHMLSTHSFNALLKTLEEPPPHVKFLLATTDPQKLPVTVLSRCLQFNLKRLPVGQIVDRIKEILTAEGVPHDVAGVRLVAQAADGSMRDGLSLLDQLIAFSGGKVGEEEARAMLGTVARDHVVKLVELLGAADVRAVVSYAGSLDQWAPDYAQLLDEFASLLARVAMRQVVSDYEGDELYSPELLESLAKALAPEDVQLFYQTAIVGRRDLGLAPDPRVGFEMTLVRMLAFRPGDAGPELPRAPVPRSGSASGPAAGDRAGGMAGAGARPAVRSPDANPASGTQSAAAAVPDDGSWGGILAALDLPPMARQLASHCVLLERKGAVVRLALDPRNQQLRTRQQEDKLAGALSRYYGEPVRLEFEISTATGVETPAQAGQRSSMEELEAAKRALESDPGARALRERFGATLVPDTVRPLK